MPLSKYFKGKGKKVMKDMKDRYGDKKGEQVFYATINRTKGLGGAPEKSNRSNRKRKTLFSRGR